MRDLALEKALSRRGRGGAALQGSVSRVGGRVLARQARAYGARRTLQIEVWTQRLCTQPVTATAFN